MHTEVTLALTPHSFSVDADWDDPEGIRIDLSGGTAEHRQGGEIYLERAVAESLVRQIEAALASLDDPEERAFHKSEE
jgi:hypothetical protein